MSVLNMFILKGLFDDMESFDSMEQKLDYLKDFYTYALLNPFAVGGWKMMGVGEGDEADLLRDGPSFDSDPELHDAVAVVWGGSRAHRVQVAGPGRRPGRGFRCGIDTASPIRGE